jgi:hypothetical protein
MPTTAVARIRSFLVLAIVTQSIAACAGDVTAPEATANRAGFQPIAASRALVGATDGEYVFTIDPTKDQSLEIGPNHLDIPRDAICRISDMRYGPQYWNDRCKSERALITITATVRNADSDHPRIDFQPALRFAPDKKVMLYMTLSEKAVKSEWTSIFYCAEDGKIGCVDESLKDADLRTTVKDRLVFRRIKHFSGYIILTRGGDE